MADGFSVPSTKLDSGRELGWSQVVSTSMKNRMRADLEEIICR